MKRIFLLSVLLSLQLFSAKAQYVTIPDPIFANKLTQMWPNCMNGNQLDTTCFQIVFASSLDVSLLNITDLTGVKYFKNLINLNCPNNLLTTLPELPKKLESIICHTNQISVLPQLPDSLHSLFAGNNNLSSLPILPNSLRVLDVSINEFTSIPELPDSLTHLWCGSNYLTNLPDLPVNLFHLYCDNNQITNLPLLPISLKVLNCSFNQLTTIPRVREAMDFFNVKNNSIYCLTNIPITPYGDISNNLLTCVPSQTSFTLGLPLCVENDIVNNPNDCANNFNISGFVYTDQNNNCIYTNGDIGTTNIPVKLYDNQDNFIAQYYTLTGTYGFSVTQTGNYKVKVDGNSIPFSMACAQADSQIVNVDSITSIISNINFPVVCGEAFDLGVQNVSTIGQIVPGQIHSLNTIISNNETWYNLFCDSSEIAATITITISGPVNFQGPRNDALVPMVNDSIFTYTIADFNSLTPSSFGLYFQTDTTAQAGDRICVYVTIATDSLDGDSTNNVYQYCYLVENSYDPNMKEVYPVNVLPGYDDWFTYTIHFQNTGNAPAFNIRLKDTLDVQLDINSFEILGYSHPAQVSLSGNILTVRFNNIMLPDSTSDYEGSMGYFQYRLKPLPNLPNGTQIENTAHIYFDYNAPIVTNTTQNNFDIALGQLEPLISKNEFVLYPNPSNGLFYFNDTKNIKQVEVYNLLGESILAQGNQKQINLSGFAKGIYYVRINGEVVVKLVKE